MFSGRDVIFFVDNEAACSSLIKGSTASQDVGEIAAVTHLFLCKYNVRAWFEWIDSKSNPSDGLSRLGLNDPWSQRQGWFLRNWDCPDWMGVLEDPSLLLGLTLGTLG